MTLFLFRAVLAIVVCSVFSAQAEAQTIGSSMVTFLNGNIGVRIGGGECSHMATEGLRVSGGEFYPGDLGADSPSTGDYVWGTLITKITVTSTTSGKITTYKVSDSAPTVSVLPGDVIQYVGGVKLGTTSFPTRHTSVVYTVNTATASRPTAIFQQNFGGVRTVKTASINITTLTAGSLYIYRPKVRIDASNVWKFTVVNNCTTSQTYAINVGTSTIGTLSSTAANTAGSFQVHKVGTTGTVPDVAIGTAYIYVQNAKGDQFAGSPVALTQLSP